MLSVVYRGKGDFALLDKPLPQLQDEKDAIVRVTLSSICQSDIHIKHGSVPRAVPGTTVGHEFVGVVEEVGPGVKKLKPGMRVAANVETFCGECFFCKRGFVNNCTDKNGGWALGCRIDGGQAPFVRVPFADNGLTPIPEGISDEKALFTGDILATGYWAAGLGEIQPADTVAVIGAGPTGMCTLMLTEGRGADTVLEVAGARNTFELAWRIARPNAVVCVVALYDQPQVIPLPDMYGKNLIFKTGGVDGNKCEEILKLIKAGRLDPSFLITHRYPLQDAMAAYELFEKKEDGVIKVALEP